MISEAIYNTAVLLDMLFQPEVWGAADPYLKLNADRIHCSADVTPLEAQTHFYQDEKTLGVTGKIKITLVWGLPGVLRYEQLPIAEFCDALLLAQHVLKNSLGVLQLPKEYIIQVPLWPFTMTDYSYIDWKREERPVKIVSVSTQSFYDVRQNADGHWLLTANILVDMKWTIELKELSRRCSDNPFVVKNNRYGIYTDELLHVNSVTLSGFNARTYEKFFETVINEAAINENNVSGNP